LDWRFGLRGGLLASAIASTATQSVANTTTGRHFIVGELGDVDDNVLDVTHFKRESEGHVFSLSAVPTSSRQYVMALMRARLSEIRGRSGGPRCYPCSH